MKKAAGFTLVELIIVIVVIGILTAIAAMSFTYVQKNARDSTRNSSLNQVAEALEKYYAQNGEYPGCNAMTQSGSLVTTNVLPGLDPATLVAPKSTAGTTNSFGCTSLTGGSGPDTYAYVGDSASTCTTGTACVQYTLQYREEASGNIISLTSRHHP